MPALPVECPSITPIAVVVSNRRPNMCLANANRLVKCFKRPFGLEDKFRKRNFDAIIEMTGGFAHC
jgi:hypothetical protein